MFVTPIYAAILSFIFVTISVRTILIRRKLQIAIGDGDQPLLARAARVHTNFAKYVPLSLILIYFLETCSVSKLWIHLLCITLVIGRVTHALGISQAKENYRYRVTGMALTFTAILSASLGLLTVYAIASTTKNL